MSDGPKSLQDWIKYLHAAATVEEGDPDYGEAQEAVKQALGRINALNVTANVREQEELFQDQPSAAVAGAGSALHTAGAGTGELFSGLAGLVRGEGFGAGAEEYRAALNRLEETSPTAANIGTAVGLIGPSAVGSIAGKVATPVVRAGVPLGARAITGAVARGAGTGATLGGLSGFSSGGATGGDLGGRLEQGMRGAIMGALIGGASSGVGLGLARRGAERRADFIERGQRRANVTRRGEVLEAQRDLLRKKAAAFGRRPERPISGGPLDDITQAQEDFAAGKISEQDFNTAMEMAGQQMRRPRATELPIRGEVQASAPALEPIPGTTRGFTAEGPPMPQGPFPPTIAELQRGITRPTVLEDPVAQQMARTGMGSPAKGVGGHSYSGTYPKGTTVAAGAARTVPSPVGGPAGLAGKQLQAIQETLAKASPEEVPGVLQNLEAMGILTKQQVAELLGAVP